MIYSTLSLSLHYVHYIIHITRNKIKQNKIRIISFQEPLRYRTRYLQLFSVDCLSVPVSNFSEILFAFIYLTLELNLVPVRGVLRAKKR